MNAIGEPIAVQKQMTPRNIQSPRRKALAREPPACCDSVMTLMGMTGRTHGVRFMIAPPTAPARKSMRMPTGPRGSGSWMPKMEGRTPSEVVASLLLVGLCGGLVVAEPLLPEGGLVVL